MRNSVERPQEAILGEELLATVTPWADVGKPGVI
jgi:hypothetical protein